MSVPCPVTMIPNVSKGGALVVAVIAVLVVLAMAARSQGNAQPQPPR